MKELQDQTLVKSIEIIDRDGYSHRVSDEYARVGGDGISIYYKEPGKDEELLACFNYRTAFLIASVIAALLPEGMSIEE